MSRGAYRVISVVWVLVAITTVLALGVGKSLDDYIHEQFVERGAWFTLYDFFGGEELGPHRLLGHLPWWAAPELSLRFFRPLSSFFLAVDHHLLDGGGLLSHLHGFAWYVAVLFVSHRVLCQLVGPTVALPSTAMYALASWHAFPLAFIAARHAHVTAVFAFWSLSYMLSAGNPARAPHARWYAAALLALALFAGESALLVVPIGGSWLLSRYGRWATMTALWPVLSVSFIYLVLYTLGGHGARGSGLYLSPFSIEFFVQLPQRWLALIADLLGSLANDVAMLGVGLLQTLWGIVALTTASLVLMRGLTDGGELKRSLTALLTGAFVSLVPASAAMPGGRSLVVVGLAASAVFGSVATHCVQNWAKLPRGRALALLSWVAVFGVGAHPLFRTLLPLDLGRLGKQVVTDARWLSEACSGRVVLAAGVLDPNVFYLSYVIESLGLPRPNAVHVLTMAPGRHDVSTLDDGVYSLRVEGDFFAQPWSRIHRGRPLEVQEQQRLLGLDLSVVETGERTVMRLDLPSHQDTCWITSKGDQSILFTPPRTWTPTTLP